MYVEVNRDSVCMADDVDDHRLSIKILDRYCLKEIYAIFKQLKDAHYLPCMSGAQWEVWINNQNILAIFSEDLKKILSVIQVPLKNSSSLKSKGLLSLHFKYLSGS